MDSYSAIFSRISPQLFQNLVHRKLRKPIELQFEDRVHLPQRQAALFVGQAFAVEIDDDIGSLAPGVQVFAGFDAGSRTADNLDHCIEIVEGDLVTLEDVFALARLAQHEDGAALHHIDAVLDERADGGVKR